MSSEQIIAAVRALHHIVPRWGCGAVSEPMDHKHQFSGVRVTKPMKCSEDAGHEGPHRDCICCYNYTTFTEDQVVRMEPIDRRLCTCGNRWPCSTAVLVARS